MADGSTTREELVRELDFLRRKVAVLESSVTDRDKAERRLREREASLRIVNAQMNEAQRIAGIGSWFYRNGWELPRWSDEMFRIFGLDPARGAPSYVEFRSLIHPDQHPFLDEAVRTALDTGKGYSLELRVLRPDGTERIVHQKCETFISGDGEPPLILGTTQDITDRRRAEEALRESEGKFRDLAEKSIVGIYLMQDDVFRYVNGEFARIFGYRAGEMIDRMGSKDVIFGEDLARVRESLKKRVSGEWKSLRYEFRIVRKDGEIRSVEIYSSRTLYRGRPAVIGTMLDTSDRRKTEEELKRLSTAVDQVAEEIVITDPEGIIQYVNPAFERITGYARSEAMGNTPRLLKSGVHEPSFYEHLWRTIKNGSIWTGRITNRRKDGRLILEDAAISPLLGSGGNLTGFVSVKRDVTQAVRLEESLRQAQKMEAIGTLAGGIAHDFNNILGAMMGYTELALFKTEDDRIRPYLEQVLKASNRARDLIRQILTFSRQGEQERKPMAVTPIVKETMKLLRSSLPSTVEIRQTYATVRDTVLADPTHIHRILLNLCTNAVQAMKDREGVLEVRLDPREAAAGDPEGGPRDKGNRFLRLTVSDTGEGIDPAIRDRIFDPFFTTRKSGESTGLGLSVVYGIVKDLGGSVSVDSEPGKGTRFTVDLPLIDPVEPGMGLESTVVPGGKGRILFVDDEEPIASLGKEMLSSLGYDVSVRFSSHDALAMFRAAPHRFDLVITDMTMPNMTGERMAREMLKIRPRLPIILATGFSERIGEEEAKKAGIREFMMKPVSLQDLARTVRRVLDQATAAGDR